MLECWFNNRLGYKWLVLQLDSIDAFSEFFSILCKQECTVKLGFSEDFERRERYGIDEELGLVILYISTS